jgi:tetratricopeptide (TPR) repeat protein
MSASDLKSSGVAIHAVSGEFVVASAVVQGLAKVVKLKGVVAVESMKAALDAVVDVVHLYNAAAAARSHSEIQLKQGRIAESIESAEQSVDYADRSGDAFVRMAVRAALADALHQAGRLDKAEDSFRQGEETQKDFHPGFPLLYSQAGYQYCDLLLSRGRYEDVLNRAEKMFEWRLPGDPVLDIALDHLSLARAALMAAQSGRADAAQQARTHVQAAVDTIRKAGTQHHLPRGLLGRAEFYRFTGERDAARRDLDEAMDIATRDPAGQMKLFVTDVHLARARLDLDDGRPEDARENIDAAAALIQQTGYHRRDAELAELREHLQANGGREP